MRLKKKTGSVKNFSRSFSNAYPQNAIFGLWPKREESGKITIQERRRKQKENKGRQTERKIDRGREEYILRVRKGADTRETTMWIARRNYTDGESALSTRQHRSAVITLTTTE